MTRAAASQSIDPRPLVERRLTFGTYRVRGAEAADAVRRALERGVRRIDTAQLYKNEDVVYGAIRAFEAAHPEVGPIHVCSKIRANLLFADTIAAVEDSVQRLGRPLDTMLLHRPLPHVMWRALDACVERGLVGEIGLSNYSIERIAALVRIQSLFVFREGGHGVARVSAGQERQLAARQHLIVRGPDLR